MESFATLIKSRKSTRKFTDQLLNPEQVEMILKAALMAPASKRKNPWQFVVVEDKEMLAKLSVCKPAGAAFLKDCALAVVVLANVMESDVWVEDASIASIYMQLQAEDLGLLDVPYQLDVLSIIGIGYKDQERKPFDESHLQWEKIHLGTFRMPIENEQGKV